MNFLNRSKIDDRNAKALLAESYNELSQQFSTFTHLQEVGNYKILRQIGEGSFGKVFLAVHKLLHIKVVLKQGKKDDPNVVREVYYQREFRHPNLTKLYEVVVTDCYIYMCLEWCPEGELYDHLIKYKRLPLPKIKKIFSQLCGSVFYIHQMNSCHRDLKLENILLDKKKHVKLADFGFTREMPGKKDSNLLLPQQNTLLETICGTTVYMAPELIDKKPYSGVQIDIWSLGVILYTITYGGMPFDEEDDLKTKYKILNGEPLYIEDVPNDIIELMKMMLNKDPLERPQSLHQVLQHPFLLPYGVKQLEIVETLLTKPNKPFQSKLEKHLLKKLARLHFDTKSLVESVYENRADSISGLWELMLEKERKSEMHKRKKLGRSRSVLRLSQAISPSSPKSHSRKNSANASNLMLMLSNGNCSNSIEKNGGQVTNFDSYSQTLKDDSVVSPTKSNPSTTRVNTSLSSRSVDFADPEFKHKQTSVSSIVDPSFSPTKKNNILKKLSKFWNTKITKKDGEESGAGENGGVVGPNGGVIPEEEYYNQEIQRVLSISPSNGQDKTSIEPLDVQHPQELLELIDETKISQPQSLMKRSTSSSSGSRPLRPVSMLSTYSSYSQLTTMSETSGGSDNNTSYSTDTTMPQLPQSTYRPQYYRARSSDFSIQSKLSNNKNNEPLSSNSSTTNISRSTSIDSSRSNSVKNRGRPKQLKKNASFFMKRGKSPLGQSNRFVMNRKKKGLMNNRKQRASVIQEEYESSLSNSTSNLSLHEIPPSNSSISGAAGDVDENFVGGFESDIDEEEDNYFNEHKLLMD